MDDDDPPFEAMNDDDYFITFNEINIAIIYYWQ